jgi:hypothetical protein
MISSWIILPKKTTSRTMELPKKVASRSLRRGRRRGQRSKLNKRGRMARRASSETTRWICPTKAITIRRMTNREINLKSGTIFLMRTSSNLNYLKSSNARCYRTSKSLNVPSSSRPSKVLFRTSWSHLRSIAR